MKAHLTLVPQKSQPEANIEFGLLPMAYYFARNQQNEIQLLESYPEIKAALKAERPLLLFDPLESDLKITGTGPELKRFLQELESLTRAKRGLLDPATQNAQKYIVNDLEHSHMRIQFHKEILDVSSPESRRDVFAVLLAVLRQCEDRVDLKSDVSEVRKELIEWYLKDSGEAKMPLWALDPRS